MTPSAKVISLHMSNENVGLISFSSLGSAPAKGTGCIAKQVGHWRSWTTIES
jgi:hypothetical protein